MHDIPTIGSLAALAGMTVDDTATNISSDLLLNASSNLCVYLGADITGVTVTGGTVDLQYANLSDVQAAALALLPPGTLAVTEVPVAQVATMVSFPGLYQMLVSDTAQNVQNDIASGGAHALETNHALITGITVTSGTVTLSDADATAGLDALALLSGSDVLVVTGVAVADIATFSGPGALDHLAVSDSNVNVQADLAQANSVLEQNAAVVQSIGFSSGSSVTLTGTEAGRDMDVLGALPAASLTVTNAAASQVGALGALASLSSMTGQRDRGGYRRRPGAGRRFGDRGAYRSDRRHCRHQWHDLVAGQRRQPGDGRPGGAAERNVDGDRRAGCAHRRHRRLGSVLISMAVADTGGAISSDLALGVGSAIETYAGSITGVSVSNGSVSLTDGEVGAVTAAITLLPSDSLTVTNVAVADIATIHGLGAPLAAMAVSDTGTSVTSDLISGGAIEAAIDRIASIGLTSGSVA